MNWPQLKYRIEVGGVPWVAKTALGFARERLMARSSHSSHDTESHEIGAMDTQAPRILYIHSGWAIETVGRLWFERQDVARVRFIKAGSPLLTPEFMRRFDLVWYGYSSLFRNHPCEPQRAVLAVHDPAELFPEQADWNSACSIGGERIEHLGSMRAVVTISVEMQDVLTAAGLEILRIPTRSGIPPRNPGDLCEMPPAILAVGRIYRRKNFEQFQRIARQVRGIGCRAYLKGDHFPLSDDAYISLLDRHPIYVCTSFQEGGPLPLMDAMHRGAVVLTSPVGQAPEIIEHGENGFICRSDSDFLGVIGDLARSPAKLLALRRASLARIREARPPELVKSAASEVLAALLGCAES